MKIVEVKVGMQIGRKVVQDVFMRGPYTYVVTKCTCFYGTVSKPTPLSALVRGSAVSCIRCYRDEMRAAIAMARRALVSKRRLEAEAVKKIFNPALDKE